MTKFVDSVGLKRFALKMINVVGWKVTNGTWLPLKAGKDADGNIVSGAIVEGIGTTATGVHAHAEGYKNIRKRRELARRGNKFSCKWQ